MTPSIALSDDERNTLLLHLRSASDPAPRPAPGAGSPLRAAAGAGARLAPPPRRPLLLQPHRRTLAGTLPRRPPGRPGRPPPGRAAGPRRRLAGRPGGLGDRPDAPRL